MSTKIHKGFPIINLFRVRVSGFMSSWFKCFLVTLNYFAADLLNNLYVPFVCLASGMVSLCFRIFLYLTNSTFILTTTLRIKAFSPTLQPGRCTSSGKKMAKLPGVIVTFDSLSTFS